MTIPRTQSTFRTSAAGIHFGPSVAINVSLAAATPASAGRVTVELNRMHVKALLRSSVGLSCRRENSGRETAWIDEVQAATTEFIMRSARR